VAARVPDSDRARPAADVAAAWARVAGQPVAAAIDDVDAALERALELAAASHGLLVVTGSLYLVGHVRSRLCPDVGPD
jgi:folylpolyglutamate synthase/dihydropteroate synthase